MPDTSRVVPKFFRESVVVKGSSIDAQVFHESEKERPLVIFPEIKAITADWITKNYTYYPSESLIGNPSKGTGLISFTHPYNIPVIRDHNAGGGFFGGEASVPYGRVYAAEFVKPTVGNAWVRAIPAITDPWAIDMIMSGRFMTVSIGSQTDEVYCSVCRAQGKDVNMVEEGWNCDHYKGETYDGVRCYWIIGPVEMHEISFVNVPADVNAGVLNRNLDIAEVKTLVGGGDSDYLMDMATGARESIDIYCANRLNISRRQYEGILKQARRRKDECGQIHKLGCALAEQHVPLRDYVKGL